MLLLIGCSIYAQRIIRDENLADYRKIQTDYYPIVKKGLAEIPMSLMYFKYANSEMSHYSIVVKITLGSSQQSLPKGSKIYIKLDNDEIVEGESMHEINTYDNEHEWIEAFHSMYYYMYPQYRFSEESITKMIDNKVQKIRIQVTWGNGFFDIPDGSIFKEKHLRFSESLSLMKNAINNRVKQASTQSDILQGF